MVVEENLSVASAWGQDAAPVVAYSDDCFERSCARRPRNAECDEFGARAAEKVIQVDAHVDCSPGVSHGGADCMYGPVPVLGDDTRGSVN